MDSKKPSGSGTNASGICEAEQRSEIVQQRTLVRGS